MAGGGSGDLAFRRWSDEELAVLRALELEFRGLKGNAKSEACYHAFKEGGYDRSLASITTRLYQMIRAEGDLAPDPASTASHEGFDTANSSNVQFQQRNFSDNADINVGPFALQRPSSAGTHGALSPSTANHLSSTDTHSQSHPQEQTPSFSDLLESIQPHSLLLPHGLRQPSDQQQQQYEPALDYDSSFHSPATGDEEYRDLPDLESLGNQGVGGFVDDHVSNEEGSEDEGDGVGGGGQGGEEGAEVRLNREHSQSSSSLTTNTEAAVDEDSNDTHQPAAPNPAPLPPPPARAAPSKPQPSRKRLTPAEASAAAAQEREQERVKRQAMEKPPRRRTTTARSATVREESTAPATRQGPTAAASSSSSRASTSKAPASPTRSGLRQRPPPPPARTTTVSKSRNKTVPASTPDFASTSSSTASASTPAPAPAAHPQNGHQYAHQRFPPPPQLHIPAPQCHQNPQHAQVPQPRFRGPFPPQLLQGPHHIVQQHQQQHHQHQQQQQPPKYQSEEDRERQSLLNSLANMSEMGVALSRKWRT